MVDPRYMPVGLRLVEREDAPLTADEWALLQELTHTKVARYITYLEGQVMHLEYLVERDAREAMPCSRGGCELDMDGHGGRLTACRACPYHPLREVDHPVVEAYLLPPVA